MNRNHGKRCVMRIWETRDVDLTRQVNPLPRKLVCVSLFRVSFSQMMILRFLSLACHT